MRVWGLIPALVILLSASPALRQGWIEYTSKADLFRVNFPGEPKVGEIRYTSAFDGVFPGRVYTYDSGPSRYSVAVIDYRAAERIHAERLKNCLPDAQSLCHGSEPDGAQNSSGQGS